MNKVTPKTFSFRARLKSFTYAFQGLSEMLKTEHNTWVHLSATIIVIILGFYEQISANEWCMIILATMAVWVSEALNTAFEFLCDVTSPDFHPLVQKSKDVAAGAVLLSAIGAVIIAMIIFLPKI